MKGIILTAHSGARLFPLTLAVPKQLLPVYDKPMIYYPVETLVQSGITEIMVITSKEHSHLFEKALGDGSKFGAKFHYALQEQPRGLAEALTIAGDFVDENGVCLTTGDNVIVGPSFAPYICQAEDAVKKSGSATIFVTREQFDDQYGRVVLDKSGKRMDIVGGEESVFYNSIVGIYVYPPDAVNYADNIGLSERGRKEITSLNKIYFDKNRLQVITLRKDIVWLDVNTPQNILNSSLFIKNQKYHGR